MIQFFIQKDVWDWSKGMRGAAKGGYLHLI
jgi:hypothetical protein